MSEDRQTAEDGYITDEQIKQALEFQKTDEGKGKRLGDLLLQLGFVTEKQVLEALGKKLDLPIVRLEDMEFDLSFVAKIPKPILEKYCAIPVAEKNGRLIPRSVCVSTGLWWTMQLSQGQCIPLWSPVLRS